MRASFSLDLCQALHPSWRAVPDHSTLSGLQTLLTKSGGVTLRGKPCPRHSSSGNVFPWKSSLLNDVLKRQRGTEDSYCQVFSQSAVGFWVMALETEGDKTTGSITIHSHSKGKR